MFFVLQFVLIDMSKSNITKAKKKFGYYKTYLNCFFKRVLKHLRVLLILLRVSLDKIHNIS